MRMPRGTMAPAPTRLSRPTLHSSTVAPMPMRQPSAIQAPWTTALWPTVTPRPMRVGRPWSLCTAVRSWMLVSAPTRMASTSPRREHRGQTEARAPRDTRPMTSAESCTKALGWTRGACRPKVRSISLIDCSKT